MSVVALYYSNVCELSLTGLPGLLRVAFPPLRVGFDTSVLSPERKLTGGADSLVQSPQSSDGPRM